VGAERLQKVISRRGLASRREAEAWIRAGRVRVNGRVVTEMGIRVDPGVDRIEVDGRPLPPEDPRVVVLLNKPAGYVSTVRDPHAARTVMDLLEGVAERVYPVGRLDRDTRGVLLLTNDGDLAHELLHPSRGVDKVYRVRVRGRLGREALDRLARGVILDDGPTASARVWDVRRTEGETVFRIAMHEGRKRQVRRMVEAVGARMLDLERVAFGPITTAGVPEGRWRYLAPDEVRALRKAVRTGQDRGIPEVRGAGGGGGTALGPRRRRRSGAR